jgi:uncharacterized heparinase superfamily protein
MNRARLLFESVRHTRARQLASRLTLTLKRRVLERFPPLGDARSSVDGAAVPPVALLPPPPVFAARTQLAVGRDGLWRARFLNHEHALTPTCVWRGFDWPHGQPLARLTLHYMEFLEGVDDAAFASIVLDWIDRNPPYRRGYWNADWNAFALSIRTVVWMQQWVARGVDPGSPFAARLLGSLTRQLVFLERNLEVDIGGNHLLKNVKALLWAGAFFSGPAAARWSALGQRLLARELAEQILADGMHFERSPAYHAQVTADLLECWAVHPEGPGRESLGRALAIEALADLTHPDGAPSLFGDGGLHMAYPPAEILEAIERHVGVRAPARPVFALDTAGYFGARSDVGLVVADCGPIGPDHLPAHAHGDILAFEWSLRGRRVIVDTGVFEYAPGRARDRSRSTSAHNTLTVEGCDQAEFWSSFRVGRRPRVVVDLFERHGDGFVLEGHHDGFRRLAGSPRHTRRLTVRPEAIAVDDRVDGGSGQQASARLLLAPGFDAVRGDGGFVIEGGGLRIRLRTSAAVSVADAPYWPDFGVEHPARQIVFDYGNAPCAGTFTLELEG